MIHKVSETCKVSTLKSVQVGIISTFKIVDHLMEELLCYKQEMNGKLHPCSKLTTVLLFP